MTSALLALALLSGCTTLSSILPGGGNDSASCCSTQSPPQLPHLPQPSQQARIAPAGPLPIGPAPTAQMPRQAPMPTSNAMVASPSKLTAVGYGASGNNYSQQLSSGQQKLMAIRAAQVDAYRNLAEQVYGFRIIGNTAVSSFATQSDGMRAYVDAFIRGARVVGTTAIADGSYEVTVELDISYQFIGCLSGELSCSSPSPQRSAANTPACTSYGCVGTSSTYVTGE